MNFFSGFYEKNRLKKIVFAFLVIFTCFQVFGKVFAFTPSPGKYVNPTSLPSTPSSDESYDNNFVNCDTDLSDSDITNVIQAANYLNCENIYVNNKQGTLIANEITRLAKIFYNTSTQKEKDKLNGEITKLTNDPQKLEYKKIKKRIEILKKRIEEVSIPTPSPNQSVNQKSMIYNPSLWNWPLIISLLSILMSSFLFYLYFAFKNNLISQFQKNEIYIKNLSKDITKTNKSIDKIVEQINKSISSIRTEIKNIKDDINNIRGIVVDNNTVNKPSENNLRKDYRQGIDEISFDFQNDDEINKDPIYSLCEEHYKTSKRDFLKKYSEHQLIDIINSNDVAYSNATPLFQVKETGKYIALPLPEVSDSKKYILYTKGTNISSEDRAMRSIFEFDKEPEENKTYDNWTIVKPSVFMENNGKWTMMEKGRIKLDKN